MASSPYLAQFLQQQPAQPMSAGGAGLGLAAQALQQFAQGRHMRQQQDTSLGAPVYGAQDMPAMQGMMPGGVQSMSAKPVDGQASTFAGNNQFGGLFGLGQKLKGLFSGG